MSRADKTVTNAWYDIEIDPATVMPKKVSLTVLTGQKNATITKDDKIVGGEHVAFTFSYALSGFDKTKVEFPEDARKELAKLK